MIRKLKSAYRFIVGTALDFMRAPLVREIDNSQHTGRNIRLKNWVLESRKARARLRGDNASIEREQFRYWKGDTADFFYDRFRTRMEKWFFGPHQVIVDQLADLTARIAFDRLIEVGCGDGQVLQHLATRIPQVQQFVGVDINPTIIERNQTSFASNPRLSFVSANAATWLPDQISDGLILMTYGGVMEYFAPDVLSAIFSQMAQHKRMAVALVEPVDPAHDLRTDPGSHVFGSENSFSHNHQQLLEAAGFTVAFVQEINLGQVRWVLLIATANT